MTAPTAVDRPDESTWGDLPKGACVYLVHPDGRILGRQDKTLDLPVWHVPGAARHKGDSARENAVRALAEQVGVGVRTAMLNPLHSGPNPEENGWQFQDAFWVLWNASFEHPVSRDADHRVAWISLEALMAQRELSGFEAEAIGHLAVALRAHHPQWAA